MTGYYPATRGVDAQVPVSPVHRNQNIENPVPLPKISRQQVLCDATQTQKLESCSLQHGRHAPLTWKIDTLLQKLHYILVSQIETKKATSFSYLRILFDETFKAYH